MMAMISPANARIRHRKNAAPPPAVALPPFAYARYTVTHVKTTAIAPRQSLMRARIDIFLLVNKCFLVLFHSKIFPFHCFYFECYCLSNYLQNLYEDKVNGVVTPEQFKDLMANYNKDEDTFNDQIKSITNEIAYYKMKEESSKNNKEIFSKYQKLEELNRVIAQEFIDKIYIGKLNEETKSRDIQIKWNFE